MLDSQFVTFFVVAGMLTLNPGPGFMLVLRNVLQGDRYDGIITSSGICLAFLGHAMFSVLGLSAILLHSTAAFNLVKLIGACYMIWLGVQSLRRAARGATALSGPETSASQEIVRKPVCLMEGFLITILNPKSALFYLAFLPQFIGPSDPVLQKSMLLTSIHIVQTMLWMVIVSAAVDQARRFLLNATVRRWMDGGSGALLVGFGVRLAFAYK